jgi:uncharacterized membrane protein YoaK (UPF0700 family)
MIIGTISSFFPGYVPVLLYSQLFSSFISGRVTVQLYSRHFQLYSQPCYCTDLFPAVLMFSVIPDHFKPYSWPCNCTAIFPALSSFIPNRVTVQLYSQPFSSFIPGRVTVQIYSRPYSALFSSDAMLVFLLSSRDCSVWTRQNRVT